MGRCNYADLVDLKGYINDDSTKEELPVSICDKKATWTFIIKTMDIGECTGKGIYHVCDFHIQGLKDSFQNKIEENQTTYCPSCHKYHRNAMIRYRFRRGTY